MKMRVFLIACVAALATFSARAQVMDLPINGVDGLQRVLAVSILCPTSVVNKSPVGLCNFGSGGGGGGGSNAAAGTTGTAPPSAASYTGFLSGGNLVGVSSTNPLPISGSISATNPSVGATGSAAPSSATLLGMVSGSNLVGLSASNPMPTGAPASAYVDGWNATQGTKADAAYSGTGAASEIAILKAIFASLAPQNVSAAPHVSAATSVTTSSTTIFTAAARYSLRVWNLAASGGASLYCTDDGSAPTSTNASFIVAAQGGYERDTPAFVSSSAIACIAASGTVSIKAEAYP